MLKSQYPQRVAQNGTCTYTPKGRVPSPASACPGNVNATGAEISLTRPVSLIDAGRHSAGVFSGVMRIPGSGAGWTTS
ncbi:hypothetical protein GCM10027445_23360 [Amycolatopsis endophytica]